MKSISCFLTASIMSVIMFAWANFFFLLNQDPENVFLQNKLALLLLQGALLIKYITGSLLIMPNKIIIKQIGFGFIITDLVLTAYTGTINFPIEIVMVQLMLMAVYVSFKERYAIKQRFNQLFAAKSRVIIQSINA
jgi:hypothetical protein